MDRNELIRQFLTFFPNGTPDMLSDQDLSNYIRAATVQMTEGGPSNPFYGTSQGRVQAGMGPINLSQLYSQPTAAPQRNYIQPAIENSRPASSYAQPLTTSASSIANPRQQPGFFPSAPRSTGYSYINGTGGLSQMYSNQIGQPWMSGNMGWGNTLSNFYDPRRRMF